MGADRKYAPKPHLYWFVFLGWLATVAWFQPRLLTLLAVADTRWDWTALAFFIVFTELAWLYAFYNIGVVVFAVIYRRFYRADYLASPEFPGDLPPVAILYTCCNDFLAPSAESCLAQDYPRFTLYLLDDSSDSAVQNEVEAFAEKHRDLVRVVRRSNRRGFKAGNINHGLTSAATREPLFVLADADEILPADFLRRLVPRLLAQPGCGFIQANHRSNPGASSSLAEALGGGIDVHWRWYHPLRNRYGFVMLLGHGALIRRRCWEDVGGFPELVSEDLAFALRIRERGWRGVFAEDVVCWEDFPETIRAFRIRHMKWTRGTCEFLFREMRRALFSPRLSLVEKLDVLFPTLNLPFALFYFLFLVDANLLLAALFSRAHEVTLQLGPWRHVFSIQVMDERFAVIQGVDFYLITVLTLFAPVLCFVLDMGRSPRQLLAFLGRSTAVYGALGPLSCLGVLGYLATGKAVFHVTADRSQSTGRSAAPAAGAGQRLHQAAKRLFFGSHPDHWAVQSFEIVCGTLFGIMCLRLFQIPSFGLAVGFVLLPVLHHVSWNHYLVRALVYAPFLLLMVGLALGGLTLLGIQTVMFGFGFHF